jgi:hypothetical protein
MTSKPDNTQTPAILYVSWQELSDLREWAQLHESEFLGRVYQRWPHLRVLPIGTQVKVIAEPETLRRLHQVYAPNTVV